MDDEQRGAEALRLQAPRRRPPPCVVLQQFAVGVDDVGVGGHRVEGLERPVAVNKAGHLAVLGGDLAHRIVEQERAAQVLEQFDQGPHQGVGAALGEPNPAAPLQGVDQGVDR